MHDLQLLGERVRPASMAGERTLPLLPPLAAMVPGGLRRGSVVAVAGPAATTLAAAVLAGPSAGGSWVAVVGVPALGLVAASEVGVDLERVVVVAPPAPEQWATVVAALADAFDAVLVRPGHRVRPGDARRLVARVRDRGGVLCQLPTGPRAWPDAPDLTFTVTEATWRGIEVGAGRLRSRRVVVEVGGRRSADRTRRAELWLPGRDGTIGLARPVTDAVASVTGPAPVAVSMGQAG